MGINEFKKIYARSYRPFNILMIANMCLILRLFWGLLRNLCYLIWVERNGLDKQKRAVELLQGYLKRSDDLEGEEDEHK